MHLFTSRRRTDTSLVSGQKFTNAKIPLTFLAPNTRSPTFCQTLWHNHKSKSQNQRLGFWKRSLKNGRKIAKESEMLELVSDTVASESQAAPHTKHANDYHLLQSPSFVAPVAPLILKQSRSICQASGRKKIIHEVYYAFGTWGLKGRCAQWDIFRIIF